METKLTIKDAASVTSDDEGCVLRRCDTDQTLIRNIHDHIELVSARLSYLDGMEVLEKDDTPEGNIPVRTSLIEHMRNNSEELSRVLLRLQGMLNRVNTLTGQKGTGQGAKIEFKG